MTNPKKANSPEKNTPQKRKKGKTTKQLMHLHLQDKAHTITAEDIETLDLNLDHPDRTPPPPEELLPSKDDRPEEEKSEDIDQKEHKITTPWDIIGG
ncbi:MAG: hypothetical protein HOP10_13575 [Chitinophagaceae bacterium]|nr:hypothetical protein [Chitinophagaceae bacterium]